MIAVRVMQVSVHQIVDMVAVGHGFMAAAGAVDMSGFMPGTYMLWGANIRVGGRYGQYMVIDMAIMRVMQVTVVQIVDVAVVHDGRMAAAWAMLVLVRADVGVATSAHVNLLKEQWKNKKTSRRLCGMAQDIAQQAMHMLVCQGIKNVFGLSAPGHQTRRVQHFQTCRNAADMGLFMDH